MSDFGERGILSNENTALTRKLKERKFYWMAPELLINGKESEKADIWSLGCVVIEMVTGTHPWIGFPNLQDLINEMKRVNVPPEIPTFVSENC